MQSFSSLCKPLSPAFLHPNNMPVRIGLVVLATDMVVEVEWREIFAGLPIEILVARIACAAEVTPKALLTMAHEIGHCASLILPDVELDAIAYGCTSGSLVIGEEKVQQLLQQGNSEQITSNPFSAIKAALAFIKAKNIVVLSPYLASVNEPFYNALDSVGYNIMAWGSLDLTLDKDIGSMNPEHLPKLIEELLAGVDAVPDAVFISCTNFKAVAKLAELEQRYGCYFISSNQVMAWHLLHQLNISLPNIKAGRLFETPSI
ncbi:maleate cis-trans isomerase family protein [Candidatus Njordibacter sp. Uisw_058]|jgi:maleate isomerase|uniref:maleate cis-trans isomerase family protein n=1 Tax=Candidatus Njordibacter sp. Uisw_058 TaxID=3230974 RepID=UPI003D4EE037|tara:strand:+ start:1741 stop:2523 length:783 start_codon:yes stop_codon:yes gene_type:complete